MFGKISLTQIVIPWIGLCASLTDLRFGKIYNKLTVPSALIGFIYSFSMWGVSGSVQSILGFGLGFLLYGWMFGLRILGGGDVKLLMALGAWVGPSCVFEIAVLGVLLGGIFSFVVLLVTGNLISFFRRMEFFFITLFMRELEIQPPEINKTLKMPFGVPISIAAVWVIFAHPLNCGWLWH